MTTYPKHGIAHEGYGLGKAVLVLSALGIFAKLLRIDLSELHVLGIRFDPDTSGLIPGFIGLALIYVYVAFGVSRAEAAIENVTDADVLAGFKKTAKSKTMLLLNGVVLPFAIFVYSMPLVLGGFAIYLLFSDSIAVVRAIWQAAT